MKVKASPEDFRVEEESSLALSDRPGPYAVYRLEKTSWDTFDLLDLIARRLGVARRDVTVAGIKDRHGSTSQLVAVRGLKGRPRALRETNFSAVPAGWTDAPLSARSIAANRFSLVLRDMDRPEARRCVANLAAMRRDGMPNYYDEQRFGSARHGGGFMGKELFLGRRERALRLYFTASKHDDRRTREMKTLRAGALGTAGASACRWPGASTAGCSSGSPPARARSARGCSRSIDGSWCSC